MQPLTQLNNTERAKLLFELFPGEIPDFLFFLKSVTDNLVGDPDQLKERWINRFCSAECWLRLAGAIQKKLDRYKQQLPKRSRLFGDQLFDGYTALYTAHCLQQYIQHGKPADAHFKNAVELLFG